MALWFQFKKKKWENTWRCITETHEKEDQVVLRSFVGNLNDLATSQISKKTGRILLFLWGIWADLVSQNEGLNC